MPVTIIIDKWNPSRVQLRKETWCYGPIVCPNYKAGPTRKVKGRKGETYEEAEWIDPHHGPAGLSNALDTGFVGRQHGEIGFRVDRDRSFLFPYA